MAMVLKRVRSALEDGGSMITAIAIDRDKNSQAAVEWAVNNLLNYSNPDCILIHVQTHSFDSKAASKEETAKFFLPFRGFCARKGIIAKEVILHDIDIPSALIDYVMTNSISNLVVGASSRSSFMRKFRSTDVATSLITAGLENCSVYVVAKGKLQTSRSASCPQTPNTSTASPKQLPLRNLLSNISLNNIPSSDTCWVASARNSSSLPRMTQQNKSGVSSTSNSPGFSVPSHSSGSLNRNSFMDVCSNSSGERSVMTSEGSSISLNTNPEMFEMQDRSASPEIQEHQQALEAEMRKLKLELKQTMELYYSVCRETTKAEDRVTELQEERKAEGSRLEAARFTEETAMGLAEMERQKSRAAIRAAEMAQRLADMETQKRKYAEMRANYEEEERRRAMNGTACSAVRYRRYAIEEIEAATNYFSNDLKIGEGGYGPVYRAAIDHTDVAIKVLRPDISHGLRQFQQEVEVLSGMRHPNMVILLGACPEYGCLVYEYMENGTLEDRLFRKDDTPSLSWRTRFRIAAEIATALRFLHSAKPEPLVHRDLKPANILLGRNFVSKISDVGLARLVPHSVADNVTQYHMTAAAGTFCYIDPEYQQTGMLGVKSDLYSFGVVLLQILTARPPIGLSPQVEKAIENDNFQEILDPTVPDWPVEEALSLAKLALKCCELRKKDRPNLATVVLPELNRLRAFGMEHEKSDSDKIEHPPTPVRTRVIQEANEKES